MSTSYENGLETTIAGLRDAVGSQLGHTEWQELTQERVNLFADATDDHQFIHVDIEAAKQTPFGGTIAHGFLTLSLLSPIVGQLLRVTDAVMGMNYGLDRVRFPTPLPVGARFRGAAELVEVSDVAGGVQVKVRVSVEVENAPKPACVAEFLVRLFGG
jgi:acyl dehydratase